MEREEVSDVVRGLEQERKNLYPGNTGSTIPATTTTQPSTTPTPTVTTTGSTGSSIPTPPPSLISTTKSPSSQYPSSLGYLSGDQTVMDRYLKYPIKVGTGVGGLKSMSLGKYSTTYGA